MGKTLVIVESPGKVKKLSEYLGSNFEVQASVGHIRDLPSKKEQIPAKIAQESWASLGVNPVTFQPYYIVSPDKTDVVRKLISARARCERVLLAMDADREGESIAWHISRVLQEKDPQRITFTEITKDAIHAAVRAPRALNMHLVSAQESRRILDRLVGYGVSPLLRGAFGRSLSGGRVQSATLNLLVVRELARMNFKSAAYWVLRAEADTSPKFSATVTHMKTRQFPGGCELARASSFTAEGQLKTGTDVLMLSAEQVKVMMGIIDKTPARVSALTRSEVRSKPKAPFVTSSLQQGGERIGMSIDAVMKSAQTLYEGGFVTYIRTDSPALSEEALQAARQEIERLFGAALVPPSPRRYATRDKNAQEAHEAIRPSGTAFRSPESLKGELSGDDFKLYTLIYQRTVASQMPDTLYEKTSVTLECGPVTLATSGKVLTFAGHTRLLDEETSGDQGEAEQTLPALKEGQELNLRSKPPEQKATSAPARFTPGTLIETMKNAGIGRPSTYKDTLEKLGKREYTVQSGKYLAPSALGLMVGTYLSQQMGKLVAKEFSASMEDDLDRVASGTLGRVAYLEHAWTNELGPTIDAASRQRPTCALPHMPGLGIEVHGDKLYLSDGRRTEYIPTTLIVGDLKPADGEAILCGTYQAPSATSSRSSAGPRKTSAEGKKPAKPRSKTAGEGRKTAASSKKPSKKAVA